jgi:hypothetical protein
MAVSKSPKITPTRSRVRASILLTPTPIAAAKLDSPTETATSTRATMGQRYRPPALCGSAQSSSCLGLTGVGAPAYLSGASERVIIDVSGPTVNSPGEFTVNPI